MSFSADSSERPLVIGIYGINGSGKSHLLAQLKHELKDGDFMFWEGSEAIGAVTPGGIEGFKALQHDEKAKFRTAAVDHIREQCIKNRAVGVVTGHFMFWEEGSEEAEPVWTESDQNTFTHIIYLDIPAPQIYHMRRQDQKRVRKTASVRHLDDWKRAEEKLLREICSTNGILFARMFPYPDLKLKTIGLIRDFQRHTIERNLAKAGSYVDAIVQDANARLETILVIDGDKTFAPEDTGELFWNKICTDRLSWDEQRTATAVFKSPLGYSHTAFRQVALLYEEALSEEAFESTCGYVAQQVNPYPDLVSLLKKTVKHDHVSAMIVTCGTARVWEKVLEHLDLLKYINVVGGGRISADFVVTPAVKAALVDRLQNNFGLEVWAFGDSPLDLPMLRKADKALVVVGAEKQRSISMEQRLKIEVDEEGFRACQILFPPSVVPRLRRATLPVVSLADDRLINTIFRRQGNLSVLHATSKNAAKIIMTPMRNATLAGPDLRERHRRCGFYLAVEYLSEILGVEDYDMPHVQGHSTKGHRLKQEKQTTIIALMRGGEPMALGINDAFPLASLIHMTVTSDLKAEHLSGRTSVVLVDSVINTGKSINGLVNRIRHFGLDLRIVVVAGVVQAEAVSEGSLLSKLSKEGGLKVIALRISDNKFTGVGSTDTGNRLFNTTYMS